MVSITACLLRFLQHYVYRVCCSASVPSGVSVMRSPPELSITPSAEGSFSHLRPLPAATPGVQYHRGLELFGHNLYYSIQWVESKDGANWELLRGLGDTGSSLPSYPSLSSDNLLYREDFPQYDTRSRHGLSSVKVVSGTLTAIRC